MEAERAHYAKGLVFVLVVSVAAFVAAHLAFDWFGSLPRAVAQGLLNGVLLFAFFALWARRRRQAEG